MREALTFEGDVDDSVITGKLSDDQSTLDGRSQEEAVRDALKNLLFLAEEAIEQAAALHNAFSEVYRTYLQDAGSGRWAHGALDTILESVSQFKRR